MVKTLNELGGLHTEEDFNFKKQYFLQQFQIFIKIIIYINVHLMDQELLFY